MSFAVTPQHEAIFAWVADPAPAQPALIIDAVAGSGKSSTLIEILRRLPATSSAAFLAFNKSAATEIEEKAKRAGLDNSAVQFRTLNAFGFRALTTSNRRVNVDSSIVRKRLAQHVGGWEEKTFASMVGKLVGAAKSQGLIPAGAKLQKKGLVDDSDQTWRSLMAQFQIDPPGDDWNLVDKAISLARRVLVEGLRDLNNIDFDDQIYLPWALDIPLPRVDWLLVDEAQDLAPTQRAMLASSIRGGGRLIAVGDPHQAIYGWRGADCDSLGAIGRDYNATTLPLSTTYRCPQTVTEMARQFVPHFECPASSPVGTITSIDTTEDGKKFDAIEWRTDDLVVCRNNAPLVTMAYKLMRQRIPVRVAGRAIGTAIHALIRKLRPTSPQDLVTKIAKHQDAMIAKARARDPDDEKVQKIVDECETALVFAQESETLADLDHMLSTMFADDGTGQVTLSSVHRAKGAEAPRVFILDYWRMPSKMARTAEAKQQEQNLIYVALTRARSELVFLTISTKKPDRSTQQPSLFGAVAQ
jgi:DNA helicase-2/ATP-dependent DNA helicase PcrA